MKIKKGDKVKVNVGKDRGKEGKVTQVFPKEEQVVVDGVNKIIKHMRGNRQGVKGQKLELFAPMAAAKVTLVCPKCNKMTRVGHKMLENKKWVRICRKCKEII